MLTALEAASSVLVVVDERSTAPLAHDDDVTPLLRAAASLRGTHVAVVSDRTSQEVMVDTRLTGVAHLLGVDVWSAPDPATTDPATTDPESAVVTLGSELGVDLAVVVSTRRDAAGVEVGVVRTFVRDGWSDAEPTFRCGRDAPGDEDAASCLARVVESIVGACAVRRSR